MDARQTKVKGFLSEPNTQFVIPVYQRNYDWTSGQCKQLLDDIIEVGSSEKMKAHFIGSIVHIHDDLYLTSTIKELTVIDGQQRLTTLTLIYLVLYRLAKELNNDSLESEISETYLINKFSPEEDKLKLKLTEKNQKALRHIFDAVDGEKCIEYSRIIENFNYFKDKINKDNYQIVLNGLSKLIFVEISLDRDKDDPQRIFESLNSTGLELAQADLIRNYILMGLNQKDQNKIYQHYWQVIEQNAKDDISNKTCVSEFIRDYLTLKNKKIPNESNVYATFKKKYPIITFKELENNLAKIKALAKHYNKLINPKNETDKDIRQHLEYINRLKINVTFPFLMKVYEDFSNHVIDKAILIAVLSTVQSFTFRRFIVGLPTSALNKIFMDLYDQIDPKNYLFSMQKSLLERSGASRFPKDTEVIDALKVKDVYNINPKNKIYLLERLENFQNKEPVMIEGNFDITIEHIFPQNPDPQWEVELGIDEYNLIKEKYLHTIGNLTLSGNNVQLSNKSFLEKQAMNSGCKEQGYQFSRLWLNRDLKEKVKWGVKDIENRAEIMAKRFIQVWEFPSINLEFKEKNDEINIFDAEDPKHKKLEYAIFFNQTLEVTQVAKLYVEVFKRLFELEPETFFTSELGERLGLTKMSQTSGLRQAVAINDMYCIESNIDNMGKFDRIKHALTLFGFEDELLIKYAD